MDVIHYPCLSPINHVIRQRNQLTESRGVKLYIISLREKKNLETRKMDR